MELWSQLVGYDDDEIVDESLDVDDAVVVEDDALTYVDFESSESEQESGLALGLELELAPRQALESLLFE